MYKKKRILVIVQARMESTRLPGKVLLDLAGKPVLQWIIERISNSKYVDKTVIAIPKTLQNKDIIMNWRQRIWKDYALIFQGSMNDVIFRVLNAAYTIKIDKNLPDIIIDITADCPLVDSYYIDLFIEKLVDNNLDYYSNIVKRTWPDGCDIQVYTLDALSSVYHKITNEKHKQHTGWNILQFPNDYKIGNYPAPKIFNYPEMRITLDTKEDYELLQIIFEEFKNFNNFSIKDVIQFIRVNPNLQKINSNIKAKIAGEG